MGWFLRVYGRHCHEFLEKDRRKSIMYYEQLTGNLCEIEIAINQQPLTFVAADIYEEVSTPYHTIFGRNIDEKCTMSLNEMTSDNVILKTFRSRVHDSITRKTHLY